MNMKTIVSKRFKGLCAFVIMIICTISLVACNEEEVISISENSISENNSVADATAESENTESTEISDNSETTDTSEVISDISDDNTSVPTIEKTPEEMLTAGEITNFFGNITDWDMKNKPLVNWYCNNMMKNYGTLTEADYICGMTYPFFENFALDQATYKVTFIKNGTFSEEKISILCGTLPEEPSTYILIDGHISESSYYSLEAVWDKVRSNEKIGPLTEEYPKAVYSEGMQELKLADIIGEGRRIFCTIPTYENNIAIISGNPGYWNIYTNQYEFENLDLKIDFVDIASGTLIKNSYYLIDLTKQGYLFTGFSNDYAFDGNTIKFTLSVKKPNSDDVYYAWYKITLNTDGTVKDTLTFNSTAPWDTDSTLNEYKPLYSESGRYQTLRKNGDLYIYDNTTKTDALVFDCKPDNADETDIDIGEYVYASELCFVGETLYYNLTGYEWNIGSASYNADTKQTIEYKNAMYVTNIIDGFAYGSTSIFDDECYFGRFSIDDPEITERLRNNNEPELTQILITNDDKYIVKISHAKYSSNNFKNWEDESTVTLYDTRTMDIVKTYTLNSATFSLQNGYLYGDYLYLPVECTDNMVYVIELR